MDLYAQKDLQLFFSFLEEESSAEMESQNEAMMESP